jgi:hypothetical protein
MVWLSSAWQGLPISAALGGKYSGPFCPQALSSSATARLIQAADADFFVFDMVKL